MMQHISIPIAEIIRRIAEMNGTGNGSSVAHDDYRPVMPPVSTSTMGGKGGKHG